MRQAYWIRQLVRAYGEERIVVAFPSKERDDLEVSYLEAGSWLSQGPRNSTPWESALPEVDGQVPDQTRNWLNARLDQPLKPNAQAQALEAWGLKVAFVLTDNGDRQHQPPVAEGLAAAMLSERLHGIQGAFTVKRLRALDRPSQLATAFTEEFCRAVMPAFYRSSPGGLWVPFCRPLYDGQALEDRRLDLGEHTVAFRAGPCDPVESDWLKAETETIYAAVLEKWELCRTPELLAAGRMDTILEEVQNSRKLLESQLQSLDTAWQNLGELRILSQQWASPNANVPYEFYRGTESWSIRFNGELVKMANKYTLGLIYIHQLLLNPDTELPCHQLYLRSKNDLNQSTPFWREVNDAYGKNSFPDDEESWQKAIQRIEPHLANATPDAAVKLLEYLVFIAEQLYRLNPSRRYFSKLTDFRHQLRSKKFDLEPGQSDQRFFRREMTVSGILYAGREDSREHRRVYQNVTKAINRTIKTMANKQIVEFFKKTLTIGQRSIYEPRKWDGDEPVWKLWAE